MNLAALTQLHEGKSSLMLAKTLLSRREYRQAQEALLAAGAHYTKALHSVERTNAKISEDLADLRSEIMSLRSALKHPENRDDA